MDGSSRTRSSSGAKKHAAPKARVYIELGLCKYALVRECAKEMGWRENKGRDAYWSIYWMDSACSAERVMKLLSFQKINHFPQMNQICRKIPLARNLKKMQKGFPRMYSFFPPTFILPHDLPTFMKPNPRIDDKVFIIKSSTGCQGRGIILTKDKSEAHKHGDAVVQCYIDNPHLIDNLKYDLRIYVLVLSVNPLRVYCYNEGLVRLCTEPYRPPTSRNLSNHYMHLSNYSINKNNKQFSSASSNHGDNSFSTGSKRSFNFLNNHLREEGHDVDKLWARIYNVINSTLISIQPELARTYEACMSAGKYGQFHCFEILGFDVMFTSKMKPILLEVNHSPSWNTDTDLDDYVKRGLIRETMRLISIDPTERLRALQKLKSESRERLTSPSSHNSSKTDADSSHTTNGKYHEQLMSQNQIEQHHIAEKKYLKNFVKIYPPTNEKTTKKYDTLLEYAEKLAEKETARSIYRETPIWKSSENRKSKSDHTTNGITAAKKKLEQKSKKVKAQVNISKKNAAVRTKRPTIKRRSPVKKRSATRTNSTDSAPPQKTQNAKKPIGESVAQDAEVAAPPRKSKRSSINQASAPLPKQRIPSAYQTAKAKYMSPKSARDDSSREDIDLDSLIAQSDQLHRQYGALANLDEAA